METPNSPIAPDSNSKPDRPFVSNRPFQVFFLGGIVILAALYVRESLITKDKDLSRIAASNDQYFESEIAKEPGLVLVKFGADWCGPCNILDVTLKAYSDMPDAIKVVYVDVDKQTELTAHYQVAQIPHSFLFLNGKVIGNRLGTMSLKDLKSWIDQTKTK